jgi:Na+:H+ antiporter, NhaA family
MGSYLRRFLQSESAAGVILLFTAALGMSLANSSLATYYTAFVQPLSFTINDGLMVIFFLAVGIEIKHEAYEGVLSTRASALFPLVAALGGIIMPALIYGALNWQSGHMRGWAIPTATDIAFSLGVLALFAKRLAPWLRIFLMSLAVIDDLVAVIIIAVFYTSQLSAPGLIMVTGCLIILYGLNRCVACLWPYLIAGMALWAAMLASGVHPTVAGVLLAWLIPLPAGKKLMHRLQPWVAFFIMPLFAFANAGIPLAGLSFDQLLHPLPLGIVLGLTIGKPLGIFITSWLLLTFGPIKLPAQSSWSEFFGVCILAGIGFTMSLFIGGLAFSDSTLLIYMRLGVIVGSLVSAIIGIMWMGIMLHKKSKKRTAT